MVYHVLPEVEAFSEYSGGALSRWAANMLRADDARIVCASSDGSWHFPVDRVLCRGGMNFYGKLLKQRDLRLRTAIRIPIARLLLRGVSAMLQRDDVLYIHNRPEYVLAVPKRADRRVPFKVVLHMHNDHLGNLSGAQASTLSSSEASADLTVFNSKFLESQGRHSIPGLKLTAVLHNGADEGCFYPTPPSGRPVDADPITTVLFVGRLVPEKGLHLLIAAMRILSDEGVKARAKIVGSVRFGDNSSSMYAESLRRNCPENVEFLPYMAGQALGEQFRRAAIFCCPSIWDEPFGMVIVEAMASGLPVVASDVGGIPEVLAHGGGMLVKRGSVLELAAAIRSLVESETRRRELGAQALAAFRAHFRWNALHQEYAGLMDSLQQPRPPARALAS